jgi:hypothetical protein
LEREAGGWFEGVDAGKEARSWKLDGGALLKNRFVLASSFQHQYQLPHPKTSLEHLVPMLLPFFLLTATLLTEPPLFPQRGFFLNDITDKQPPLFT